MTELTVCMNVYNGAQCLQTSIGSIMNQTLQDFKLLVYDDGSTDNTIEVLESYNDPRINIVRGGENKGCLYSRAMMIPMIDTEYCMWIDDDDYFCRNDAFERSLALIKAENYDIVDFAKINYVDKGGDVYEVGGIESSDFSYFGDKLFELHYPLENQNFLCSKIIKTSILQQSIPEQEIVSKRFAGDISFFSGMWYFLAKRYCHVASESPIYAYNYEIGIWGSKLNDDSVERFNEQCEFKYNVVKSLYNRMTAIRPLTVVEKTNLVKSVGFMNMCRKIRILRNQDDKTKYRELATAFHNWFCADGIHVLNDFEDIEMLDFINSLEKLIYED